MLRGFRTAVKYFTLGLLAGLLLAPRKGDDTRAILVERGRDYIKELISSGRQAAADLKDQAGDAARERFGSDSRSYDNSASSGIQ
jgi:gas vesicle protein